MNLEQGSDRGWTRRRSLGLIAAAYAMALAAGGITILVVPIEDPLGRTFAADIVATLVIFGWSFAYDNSSFYDAYWSVIPIAIVLHWIQIAPPNVLGARMALVLVVICVWGLRLTFNWARGWNGLCHEDWRYVDFRQQFPKMYWPISFAGIHFFPTLIVFAGLTAVWPVFQSGVRALGFLDAIALGVGTMGIALESLADRQLRSFVTAQGGSGGILRTGLWRYSRHPNYLGEILVWWSLYLFGLAASPEWAKWAIAAPLAMTGMFVFATIPLLEKRSLTRRPGYQNVIDEVSMLIPLGFRRR